MPAPSTSIQPSPLQVGQPSPPHLWHWTSISQLGSVKGKWWGRKRVTGALAVQLLHDGVQGALQVGHGHALVDDHALDLVEHGGVGGVHLVLAVHPAGGDDADGQLACVSMARTCMGAGLGAQQHPAVLGRSRRCPTSPGRGGPRRQLSLVKVVVGQSRPRGPSRMFKAHADEDVLDLVQST